MEILEQILKALAGAEAQAMIIAVVLEFIFRLIPTKKPLSIAHVIAKGAKVIGEVLVKIANLLDKVLPQAVKEE